MTDPTQKDDYQRQLPENSLEVPVTSGNKSEVGSSAVEVNSYEDISSQQRTIKGDVMLSSELDQLRDKQLCKICMENEVQVLFLDCRHLVTCQECSTYIETCPICRHEIQNRVKIYMS